MDIQCINISYVKHDIILIRPALFPAQAVSNIFRVFDTPHRLDGLCIHACGCVVLGAVCLRGSRECGRGRGWKVPWLASLHVFDQQFHNNNSTRAHSYPFNFTSR